MTANDRELSAIIVRNIVDIEDALAHAENNIENRLSKEFNAVFDRIFNVSKWHLSKDKDFWESWFCPKEWPISRGDRKPDNLAWFQLNITGEDVFHSWLAAFVTGTKERGIASLKFGRNVTQRAYRKAIEESQNALNQIQEAGFIIDGDDIYYPISIDAEALAAGFEKDDLAPAIEQFEKAAEALQSAMPAFDEFHANIVAAAS